MNAGCMLRVRGFTFPSALHLLGYGPKNKGENWELAVEKYMLLAWLL